MLIYQIEVPIIEKFPAVKSGRWKGVVTAFITMADSKDEIDWEFPGNATTQAQTNLYWEGVPDCKSPSMRPSFSYLPNQLNKIPMVKLLIMFLIRSPPTMITQYVVVLCQDFSFFDI